jgi:hypothetical protein
MTPSRGSLPDRLGILLALGICAGAAFWIADGVAPWDGDRSNVWHHYEYLADAFMGGHTYLPVQPPPELLKLRDPYDPVANAPYRLWDASLYQGKYYLYYGPAPAIALMVPWRILTGHRLPQRMAVAIFAAAGLAALALLLWEVRLACFPGLSGAALGGILFVAFHAAWLPVILRRPGFWELPIVAAAACLWWALYFLWRFRESGGRPGWAAAAGAALALMMGCRATTVFEAGFVLLLLLAPFPGLAPGKIARLRAAAIAAALVLAGGIALLAYNHARFGRWLEFGQSYMLTGDDNRGARLFNPSYIPFNAWTYLSSVPEFGPYFPFVHGAWPARFPPGYLMFEAMYGAFFAVPVQFAAAAGLLWAWRSRRDPAMQGAALAVAGAAASTLFAGAILFCWQGACSRYIVELVAGWTVATSVGLMALFGSDAPVRFGRPARALAVAAACWSVACVWLASAEFRGFMRVTNPATYRAVGHALDYPSLWWIRMKAIRFGPVDVDVRIPDASPVGRTILVASGFPEKVNQLAIERVGRDQVRLILAGNADSVLETQPFAVGDGQLQLRLAAPWLYPPAEHPYWDDVNEATRVELQTLFFLDRGAGALSTHSSRSFETSGFEPDVRDAPGPAPGLPYVEALRLAPLRP